MTIPGKELVGMHPTISNGVYNDDYLRQLNEFASVDEVLGEYKKGIADNSWLSIAHFALGALGHDDKYGVIGEVSLGGLLAIAAKVGSWSALDKDINQIPLLETLLNSHFGHITTHKGKAYLLPSAMFLTYCKEKSSE